MICWRCTHLIPDDEADCPHCAPRSSQKAPAGSHEVGFQVHERSTQVQSPAQWESAAPANYQVTAKLPRDTRLISGGFTSIFFGVIGLFQGGGYIVFGVIVVLCGILTLTVSRFGARTFRTLAIWELALVLPGYVIAWVFLAFIRVLLYLIKIFTTRKITIRY